MEDIEAELEAKSIEREQTNLEIKEVVSEAAQPDKQDCEPEPVVEPVKKTKRVRSEKQIAAFEKARLKRAEGIATRKKLKEEQKVQKKEEKKQVKISENVAIVKEQSVPKPVVNSTPGSSTREQVIQNHYYYYGVPPPNHDEYTKPKKKKKSKRPPTPSSSESESESEEEYYKDEPPQHEQQPQQQYYQAPPKPSYKFSYT